jgi:TorA maturation chaperone TorD
MNMTTPANEISDALLRAGIYRTLAQAFSYPDEDMVSVLKESWSSQLLFWKNGWPDGVRELLVTTLEDLQSSDVPGLAEAHVRLFGPAARCSLTETAWGDAARLLGKPAQIADISGFYAAFGLQPVSGPDATPEDHLVTELEFMSILYLKEAYAHSAGMDEQLAITRDARNKFLEEHVATWIDYWAEQVQGENPPAFYRTLATLLQDILRSECMRLGLKPLSIRTRAVDVEVGADALKCPLSASP